MPFFKLAALAILKLPLELSIQSAGGRDTKCSVRGGGGQGEGRDTEPGVRDEERGTQHYVMHDMR
jgi:hypothetical protein